jgi:anti-anti-sigma regulatory factor
VLKRTVEKNSKVIEITLKGDIEEDSFSIQDFVQDYMPGQLVRINCGEVRRINSVGIRAWIMNMKELDKRGIAYVLSECSLAIVEQMNQIQSFVPGGKVESVQAPFVCKACKREFSTIIAKDKLVEFGKPGEHLPTASCPHCKSSNTSFDDLAEYFSFVKLVTIATK